MKFSKTLQFTIEVYLENPKGFENNQQSMVFKKDKATLHVIKKRCEGLKHF